MDGKPPPPEDRFPPSTCLGVGTARGRSRLEAQSGPVNPDPRSSGTCPRLPVTEGLKVAEEGGCFPRTAARGWVVQGEVRFTSAPSPTRPPPPSCALGQVSPLLQKAWLAPLSVQWALQIISARQYEGALEKPLAASFLLLEAGNAHSACPGRYPKRKLEVCKDVDSDKPRVGPFPRKGNLLPNRTVSHC